MYIIFERVEYLGDGATLAVVQVLTETNMAIVARIDEAFIQKLVKASLSSKALCSRPT